MALAGAVLFFTGALLHPSSADPNDSPAAFAEYAKFDPWVVVHLMQLAGAVLVMGMLVLLSRRLASGPAGDWAALAAAGAIATIALYGALQAVDGIALGSLVRTWAATPQPGKDAAFQAALAVRHVEIGLSSIASAVSGLTVTLYGVALLIDRRAAWWLGGLAIAGGVPSAVAGIVIAYTGFSDLELNIGMVSNALVLLWVLALGVAALRRSSFWEAATYSPA